uniref:Arachidonate 12-lipoxygenase n=1 Tax=Mastacembelus armatus TaxID=205130 RepID=A0A7N8XAS5_9TELE
MEIYTVTVATGTSEYSGTNNYIFMTLVGEKGESERTLLDNPGLDFCRGAVDTYKVTSHLPLGSLLLVRLEKKRYWVEDNWFCRYVTVEPPGGDKVLTFPCYRWLVGDIKVEIREGIAKTLRDDSLPQLLAHRKTELQERQKTYRWSTWAPGIPRCIDAKTEADLPQDVRFENEKRSDFEHSLNYALLELSLKKLAIRFGKSWNDLDDFKRIFWKLRIYTIYVFFDSEYCMKNWKEDWFFGYQCLNGTNPRMIQRCTKLPKNFSVTANMVQSSMAPRTNLDKELQAGNIYLLDYAIMDGIPTNTINGKPQYIAAPFCLLYQHPDEGLIPIAIQLEQTPGLDTPIFLPKDPPLAWVLAKMWVRHSEFQVFQLLSHLLRTHLVVEVVCVATLRQLPVVHPIYKVHNHTSHIFRSNLSCIQFWGYKVIVGLHCVIVTRCNSSFSFVSGMLSLYYQSDQDVQEDLELQAWIRDISQEGFTDLPNFGLANKLSTREELSTLLAVAIFTSTAQHAATNNGQFDWCAWIPNTPCTMRQPPPTDKDAVTMEMIMATLPDVSQSCVQMAITWHLGRTQPDAIALGQYTEEHFTEGRAKELIDKFRTELKEIEDSILRQNEGLDLQYLILLPSRIENSITI